VILAVTGTRPLVVVVTAGLARLGLRARTGILSGVLAMALAGLTSGPAYASNVFTLDTAPDGFATVAVNGAGTGLFAWEHKVAGAEDVTMFCAVPRNAACTNPQTLASGPLNPPPFNSTPVTQPFVVLGGGSTIYVVGPRFVAADVLVWTSTDGGQTWGAPAQVAQSGAYMGTNPTDALLVGSAFDISSHNPGLYAISVPPSGTGPASGADLTPPGDLTNLSGSSLGQSGTSLVEAFGRLNAGQQGTVDFTASNGGDPNSASSWSAPAQVTTGTQPRLAGGPTGLFLLSQDYAAGATPTQVDVRKFAGSSFGAPVTLQGDTSDDSAGSIFQTPASGQVLAAWPGPGAADGGRVIRLYRSTNGGASFAAVGPIAEATPNFAIAQDSIRLAAADDGLGFMSFLDSGGRQSTLRVANFTPSNQFPTPGVAVQPNGALVLTATSPGSGVFTVTATVPTAQVARASDTASSARKKACRKGFVRHGTHCVRKPPASYGKASLSVAGAKKVTIRVNPSAVARRALAKGKRLRVSVAIRFQSVGGGTPVSKNETATVKLKKKRH
jgi:hypothetical protein